jgi:thioredoxin
MTTVDITEATFNDTVSGNPIVFIDFWAAWCGPCRQFAPTYSKVSEANPDIVFAKVDTEAEQQLAGAFNITSIPTLMAIREGVVLFANPGAMPESQLNELVAKIREVDMDDVRAQIAAQSQDSEQSTE